jgi:hypothetical protein
MSALGVILKPIPGGWIIELTDGREVARFTGPVRSAARCATSPATTSAALYVPDLAIGIGHNRLAGRLQTASESSSSSPSRPSGYTR